MPVITTGNAIIDGRNFRFWFVGAVKEWCRAQGRPFDESAYGLRSSEDIEIKWGIYSRGDERSVWASCSDRIAMSILIRGDLIFHFREEKMAGAMKEVNLKKEGDYVIWREDLEHTWKMLDDSVILTLRWRQGEKPPAGKP